MMYHHLNSDRCSNNQAIFEEHLAYISKHFNSTFPTKTFPKNPICLVFDDGYYDFYKLIFPLLKRYNIKALLAVVPKYILESCNNSDEERLNHEHNELFNHYKEGTFCTYEELEEMIASGLVQIASHSYSHQNLLEENINLEEEIIYSKQLLEKRLNIRIDSFVYPFGKYNQIILDKTMKHYNYSFRIGNGVNMDFRGIRGVIYRIDGDNLTHPSEIFSFKSMLKFRFKSFVKSIVGNK